jgi:hypothetical protein
LDVDLLGVELACWLAISGRHVNAIAVISALAVVAYLLYAAAALVNAGRAQRNVPR